MLLPRRQLKPRTFRASVGQTILVGGLARIDLLHLPAQTIYLTVWASDEVSCHYGRTDKAEERYADCTAAASCTTAAAASCTAPSTLLYESSPRAGKCCCNQVVADLLVAATFCKMPCCNQLSMLLCCAIEHSCISTVHVSWLFMRHCEQIAQAVVLRGLFPVCMLFH